MMPLNRATLPRNVRRWLDKAIPADGSVPTKILNRQEGEMDIRGKRMSFRAQTFNQAHPFTFIWKARFTVMPGVWLMAEDGHDSESGWGGAKLWGLIPLGGRNTPEVFRMQVVRSLAELPWNPPLALAAPTLIWQDTGPTTFEVGAVFGGQEVSVSFELNGAHEIVRACGRRFYDVPDGFVETGWHYRFSDCRAFGGIRIPASAVAAYDKAEGVWEYWRGRITSVEVET